MDGFYQQPSEEEMNEIRKQAELQEMAMSDFNHSFQTLFSELTLDNLKTVKTMMHFIVGTAGSPIAAQWEGMLAWEMKNRFNICVTCGVNHDEEVLPDEPPSEERASWPDFIPAPFPYRAPPPSPYPMPAVPADTIPEEEPNMGVFRELTDEEVHNMEVYHLDDLRDEESQELLGFVCTGIEGSTEGCGMQYPSIEDRMLKPPEECSGCFIKAAHG